MHKVQAPLRLGLAEMADMVRKNVDFGLKKKGCR